MSDSGFTGPPPVTPPTASDVRPQRNDVLKVVDTVGMIRDNARLQRLAGEIVAENKDGTLRIATPAGEITVQKPAARPDLIVGAKVDIEVPPGHPPRQITVRDAQPPQTQQSQTPTPEAPPRDAPPPVVTAPPRPPINIPAQPPAPTPQTPPAPVTPDLTIRLLPLPPQQAAQIIVPPAEIIDTLLPTLPAPLLVAAERIAQAAPDLLTAELLRLPLAAHAPQITAQQVANVIIPQMPVSAFVTPAPVPGGLPPAVQAPAQQLIENILGLGKAPSFLPASVTAGAPLIKFMPPVAAPAATTNFSLLTARIPPAMAAFAALTPENLIQTALTAPTAIPTTTGMVAPKMDAQIIAIAPPAVNLSAPGAPAMAVMNNPNPFMPQTAAAFAAPPAVSAGMLAGQVSGMTAQNFPVLSVALPSLNAVQDFVMQFPADNMLPGAAVTVQPPPGALATTAATTVMPPFTPLPELMTTGLWPALDEAFQALQSAAPQAAHMMAQTAIPNTAAAPRMPAVIMMFVAAMQGGDLQNWLGDKTIDTLRRIGKADIISRINRDGAAINRLTAAETAPAQDWRSMPVPMMWDNHIHKIMLHYRHDREASKDGEDKKKGTRFVLDIAPPRMGNVQLDGLHRPGESNGRLDLIVRTKETLSPPMQQAMRRLYVHALESANLSGELSFQNKNSNWVRIEE